MNKLSFQTASQMKKLANNFIEIEEDAEGYLKRLLGEILENAFIGKLSHRDYMSSKFRSLYGDQVIYFLQELEYKIHFIDENNFWIFWND